VFGDFGDDLVAAFRGGFDAGDVGVQSPIIVVERRESRG